MAKAVAYYSLLVVATLLSLGALVNGALCALLVFAFWDKTHDPVEHFRDVIATGIYLLAPLPAFQAWRLSGRGAFASSIVFALAAALPALWWLAFFSKQRWL